MGERRGTEKTPISTMSISSFSGGMNTSSNRREIRDDEASIIQNFEFDDESNDLVTRNGFVTDGTGRSSPIGSVHVFSTETAFVGILYNYSNNVVSRPLVLGSETALGTFANAGTGRWYWKQLANVAVAVTNGDTIQVVGGAPGTASHLSAAPDGRYIEEWKSRLFIVQIPGPGSPNRIQCSDLGSATNWNLGGFTNPAQGIFLDVAPGDGDVITGLFAFKERLFIFKRKKIYILRATALPETDPNNWEVVEYSKNIGCVNQSTIREVFDDVLFLSEAGVCSLSAAEGTGDFASALISQKISLLQRLDQDATELDIFGFTLIDKSQYWVCLQTGASFGGAGPVQTFVLDYKKVKQAELKWVRFTRLVPTAMDAYKISQDNIVYIIGDFVGGSNNRIGKYVANLSPSIRTYKDVINSVDTVINQTIETKLYTFGTNKIRKLFLEWALSVELPLSDDTEVNVSYIIPPQSSNTYPPILVEFIVNYDPYRILRRALLWSTTRKGRAISFNIVVNELNHGLIIHNFELMAALLGDPVTEDRIV